MFHKLLWVGVFLTSFNAHADSITDCTSGTAEDRVVCAIRQARENARAAGLDPLNPKEVALHLSNRLGYGFSPLRSPINVNSMDAYASIPGANLDRYLAEILVAELNEGAAVRGATAGKIRSLVAMRPDNLQIYLDRYLELAKQTHCFKNPTDTAFCSGVTIVGTEEERARQRSRMRSLARTSVKDQKLVANLLNSQRVSGSEVIDDNLNFGEVISEFWYNHFNVDSNKVELHLVPYEDMIRRNSFSTFRQLLTRVMKHPAMLIYLDNQANKSVNIGGVMYASNQNLGRELLELHTLGAGPGVLYDQEDVENSARILTGWTVTPFDAKATTSWKVEFFFNPVIHKFDVAPFPKVMGVTYNQIGIGKGEALIGNLANHEQTKSNICKKLTLRLRGGTVGRFDADGKFAVSTPIAPTIQRCVNAWGVDGQLKDMYLAILTSPDFYSPDVYKSTNKNPIEAVISAYRAKGLNINNIPSTGALTPDNDFLWTEGTRIRSHMLNLGSEFRSFEAPTGYSEVRARFMNASYLIKTASSNHDIVGNLEDLHMGEVAPMSQRTGMAAQESFANEFVLGARKAEIADVVNRQLLTCGAVNLSPEMMNNLYGAQTLANAKWDTVKGSKNLVSPMRTILNNYLTSREFLLK